MIKRDILEFLENKNNLLAFSAGVDSTALFFILNEFNINFDIAIVNYNIRKESKEEIEYAKSLAIKYKKRIFIKEAPRFTNNFEKKARDFRYEFFEDIIRKKNYKNLIMAHQLNDKLEWLLMRFSKGTGISEISGMSKIEKRDNFNIIRPLLDYTKNEILEYLENKKIKYFIDQSNFDLKYERNRFRPIVNKLLEDNKSGYIKSFEILEKEKNILNSSFRKICHIKKLIIVEFSNKALLGNIVSKYLKELGYLISGKERELIEKQNSIVVGRSWAIEVINNKIFISPYIKINLSKKFKEKCRVLKIPPKNRAYIFKEQIDLNQFIEADF